MEAKWTNTASKKIHNIVLCMGNAIKLLILPCPAHGASPMSACTECQGSGGSGRKGNHTSIPSPGCLPVCSTWIGNSSLQKPGALVLLQARRLRSAGVQILALPLASRLSIGRSTYTGLSVLACKMMIISFSWGCCIDWRKTCLPKTQHRVSAE